MANTEINPSAKRLLKVYDRALDELLDYLVTELASPDMSYTKQAAVMDRVNKILSTLKMQMEAGVRHELTAVFEAVNQQFMDRLKAEGITPVTAYNQLGKPEYLLDEGKLNQLIADTMSDLAAATDNTEMYVKQIIRDVFSANMGKDALQNLGQEQIISDIYKKLAEKGLSKKTLQEGFIGLVDKAGKQWNLRDYVDVVVKTKLMDADNEANRSAGLINDIDLAVISSHGATDACSKWEGSIISMNGMTEGYISYEQVKATNECFHPRCQHHLQPVRSIELVHPEILRKHKQNQKQNKQAVTDSRKN